MHWIAPSEKEAAIDMLEKRLRASADEFRANSGPKAQEYSGPIFGIIFLSFAKVRFAAQRARLLNLAETARPSRRSLGEGGRVDDPAAYHAEGILDLKPNGRFDFLANLPEAANTGAKVHEAMSEIEKHTPQLVGILPETCNRFTSILLKELLKIVYEDPATANYVTFGRIYEYLRGQFACTEGLKGVESYTASCIVRLLAEVMEPHHHRILITLRLADTRDVKFVMNQPKSRRVPRHRWPCAATPSRPRSDFAWVVPKAIPRSLRAQHRESPPKDSSRFYPNRPNSSDHSPGLGGITRGCFMT